MRAVKQLLRYVPQVPWYLIWTILIGTALSGLMIVQAASLSTILADVFPGKQALDQVWRWMLILLGVLCGRALLTWGMGIVSNQLATCVKLQLRGRLLAPLFALGPLYIAGEHCGELITSVVEGIDALDPYVSQYLPQCVLAVIAPAMILATVFFLDVPSGIILALMVPILPFLLVIAGMMAKAENRRNWQALSLMSTHFLDILQGLPTLKRFGQEKAAGEQIREVSERFRQTTMATLRIAFFSSLLLEEGATISTAIIAVEIGLRLLMGDICFQQVSYSYDGERPALRNVSLQIRRGQKVALVGPSGAGKSTLAHLLLRFLQPDSGSITVAGHALEDIPIALWRQQVAWIPQHPYVFNASVADNIRLGSPDASFAEIQSAARSAHADTFIAALPQGYDTLVGEQGVRLSGGEVQRISLARAFLKNAPLLILDEATAHLDPGIEDEVLEALAHLEQGRTVLIIAHRLNTISHADAIVVLNDGQVVEAGTHHMLLSQAGMYRQLMASYERAKG